METSTEGLNVLIKKFLQTEDAKEQYEIAQKIFMISPKDFKDMQALNRAIKHYCQKYPNVSRALDQFELMHRSIPPSTDGRMITSLRREDACATLSATRERWKLEFRERKIRSENNGKSEDPRKAAAHAIARMERMGRINAGNMKGSKRLASYLPKPIKRST